MTYASKQLIRCPKCGRNNHPDVVLCWYCHTPRDKWYSATNDGPFWLRLEREIGNVEPSCVVGCEEVES